ncbi:hypothetical protein F4861DRAFT_545063 [Xylaria intraflava]|nr:hypothetical protein F4861DRAFT_545063 [Xylaria intraflava]
MDFTTATNRLRRTFAYPSDTTPTPSRNHEDEDDGPALDEQEQEALIQSLAQQNAKRNAQFRRALLTIPALYAIPYLTVLFGALTSGRERRRAVAEMWIAVLSLSSLASTAWMLWSLPPGTTGIQALDEWAAPSQHNRPRSWPRHRSPLARYLPLLNAALCALLLLAGFAWQSRRLGDVLLAALPGALYAVVLGAKILMGGTDPERELGALRYGYKGA